MAARFMGTPCPFSFITIFTLFMLSSHAFWGSRGATCGSAKPCLDGSCCSQYGFCGNTSAFCGTGCVSLCSVSNISSSSSRMNGSEADVSAAITDDIFDQFLYARNGSDCPAPGFYNRSSFLTAAASFPAFGTSGGFNSSRRELAAFFARTAQVTAGGCYVEAINQSSLYCILDSHWDCASGKKYYGRGPLQISWNINYGPVGAALGFDGINDPDMLAKDPILSFKASLWFWMTPQPLQEYSCHEAILTSAQGYNGVVTILNGGPLDAASLKQSTDIYDTYYTILSINSNDSTIGLTGAHNTSKEKSCIGSLCNTRSKLMGTLMPLASGGMVFLALAVLVRNALHQRWCDREHGEDKTVKLERIQGLAGTPINYPYATLISATNRFTAVLGQGGFGTVYKGVLPTGEAIAVKVLTQATYTEEQFLRELETLGKLHHVNVVRLVGFCINKAKTILVYEFISNSSLEKHLFNNGKEGDSVLSWETRHEIALGIARGLSYIHEECLYKIIHRDLKPQNILLDDSFCPKISDFGLAKTIKREESSVVSGLKGTPGYMAPEFWRKRRGKLSTKFDVYGFGMVVLDLVTGRPDFKEDLLSEQACSLEWACTNSSSLGSIIDYRIVNQANLSQVKILILVALWCIQEDPAQRPSMSRVVQYLEGSIDVPPNPPQPFKGPRQAVSFSSVAIAPSESSLLQGR